MEALTAITLIVVVLVGGLGLAVGTVAWLWRALQSAGAGYAARLDAQEAEIDDLRRQVHELQKAQIANYALLQEWIQDRRQLAALYRRDTGKEPPPEPAPVARDVTADMGRMASTIARRFSVSEIDGLAFELGVDGALTGETVNSRAQSLVRVAQQRGHLLRLVELCRRERPEGGF